MAETGVTLSFAFDAQERARVRKVFAQLAKGDLSVVTAGIGEVLVSSTIQRFRAQAGPDGTPWAPLKRPRRPRKGKAARATGGVKILVDTARLQNSIHAELGDDSVEINTQKAGTDVVYAATHQYGDSGRDKLGRARNIPARPFLGITPEDEEEIAALVTDYLGVLA